MVTTLPKLTPDLTAAEVFDQVNSIRGLWTDSLDDRARIRAVCDGGIEGVQALLGRKVKGIGSDLPAPNLIHSALERLAQKLGDMPILRTDPPARARSETPAREHAEKRERIVEHYDGVCRLPLQVRQVARWLPGYGFSAWVIREHRDPYGHRYPYAELRDPWDCYPGNFGPSQQPDEIVFLRTVPLKKLVALYPEYATLIEGRNPGGYVRENGGVLLNPGGASWENPSGDGLTVAEYLTPEGTYLYLVERKLILSFVPNPLKSGPGFVFARRITFNRLQGQYAHSFGLLAQMTKQNVLELVAMEDSTFRGVNLVGEVPPGFTYQRGRFATNVLPMGTTVSAHPHDGNPQIFQSIDRNERHFRVAAGYPVTDDGQSPNSFVTGQGLDRLAGGSNLLINEYQAVISVALEELDTKRLEWDNVLYPRTIKPMSTTKDGAPHQETYRPDRDIDGNYATRRVFGVMAGLDDPSKIVAILQLLQARLIDRRTAMEQLRGLDDIPKILRNVMEDETELALIAMLRETAVNPQDPDASRARLALVQMNAKPADTKEILAKFFSPDAPQETPAEQQFLNQQPLQIPQTPPSVGTVLSRANMNGSAEGGAQIVQRF